MQDFITLEKPIQLIRPPFKDQDGKHHPQETIEISDRLEITYVDGGAQRKVITAHFKGVPSPVLLYHKEEYDNLGDTWNKQTLRTRLLEKIEKSNLELPRYLQLLFPPTLESNPNGPGTILAGMLSSMGINSTPNCSCRRRALLMNERGPQWCKENKGQILEWLEQEAKKRKLAYIQSAASLMLDKAIAKSERLLAKEQNE